MPLRTRTPSDFHSSPFQQARLVAPTSAEQSNLPNNNCCRLPSKQRSRRQEYRFLRTTNSRHPSSRRFARPLCRLANVSWHKHSLARRSARISRKARRVADMTFNTVTWIFSPAQCRSETAFAAIVRRSPDFVPSPFCCGQRAQINCRFWPVCAHLRLNATNG
jgi:hypothetical protein